MFRLRGLLHNDYQILDSTELSETDVPLQIRDESFAYNFLAKLFLDPRNQAALRMLTYELGLGIVSHKHDDLGLLRFVASQLVSGRIRIVSVKQERFVVVGERAAEDEVKPAERTGPRAQDDTTWVRFLVLDDKTGRPVPGVELAIKLPDGTSRKSKTDGSGMIYITGIPSGTCVIERMLDADALEVVSVA